MSGEFLPRPPSSKSSKVFLILIPILFLGIYFYNSSSSSSLLLKELYIEQQEFESFIKQYQKSYSTEDDYIKRFKTFRDNLSFIRVFNSKSLTYTLGPNEFLDMTSEEFSSKYLLSNTQIPITKVNSNDFTDFKAPASVNWVSKGVVGPVIDQGSLGSAVPIVIAENIASIWALNGHSYISLSYQELIDCVGPNANNGKYYEFVQKNGLTSNSIYPPAGVIGVCNKTKVAQKVVSVSGVVDVNANSASSLINSIALNPVTVYVEADQSAFMFYQTGTINSNCGANVNHILLAVGYDTTPSVPYYLAQNSWGTGWGMAGYVQIGIQDGPGVCGIQTEPTYPII
ncbi:hypothetical protein SteCoe_34561 [Stentor coeruleus]|uniref:Peptidase C1A papain C-terminal domain-containing protein n=1 Tax=Stentor coeruleus TaxID=5963 RepID=A0A1R2AU89_9CILI|nr:hypothetical protein SteCoe_34561 [Stentor coeruleus]